MTRSERNTNAHAKERQIPKPYHVGHGDGLREVVGEPRQVEKVHVVGLEHAKHLLDRRLIANRLLRKLTLNELLREWRDEENMKGAMMGSPS